MEIVLRRAVASHEGELDEVDEDAQHQLHQVENEECKADFLEWKAFCE